MIRGEKEIQLAVNVIEAERGKSYFQLVWVKFKKNRMGLLGGFIIAILALLSLLAPFFSPHDYYKLDADKAYQPPQRIHFVDAEGNFHWRPFVYNLKMDVDPVTFSRIYREDTSKPLYVRFFVRSWEYQIFGLRSNLHFFGVEEGSIHLLGTDRFGRDLLGRILLGGRISLTIALFGSVITVVLGSILGSLSGYYGGFVDMLVQRTTEVLQSFPQLPLWMALTAALPRTWSSLQVFVSMVIIFSFLNWPMLAREIRGKVLSLREQDFIVAVREMGGSSSRAIFRHLLPNCLSHMIVVLTISIPELILMESVLSFLGLGIQPPMISWGVLLQGAQRIEVIGLYPWVMSPCAFIILAVLGFNFLGDGLRDAADPYFVRRT